MGKMIVFGIFKRNVKVYTEIVPKCARKTLQAVIRGGVLSLKVLFILIDGEVMKAWLTWVTRSIFALTMGAMSSFRESLTLMRLRVFGAMPRQGSVGFVA